MMYCKQWLQVLPSQKLFLVKEIPKVLVGGCILQVGSAGTWLYTPWPGNEIVGVLLQPGKSPPEDVQSQHAGKNTAQMGYDGMGYGVDVMGCDGVWR